MEQICPVVNHYKKSSEINFAVFCKEPQ